MFCFGAFRCDKFIEKFSFPSSRITLSPPCAPATGCRQQGARCWGDPFRPSFARYPPQGCRVKKRGEGGSPYSCRSKHADEMQDGVAVLLLQLLLCAVPSNSAETGRRLNVSAAAASNATGLINVKVAFAAKGDGVADDYAALQAAIDHARVTRNGIFFPPGTTASASR